MSSQQETGILLNHAHNGVGYKLLELPPELVALLESENAPILTIESSTNSAILKSGTQSWGLRQKNTSNALILIQPSNETNTTLSQIPEIGLKAIATVHDTIELASEPTGETAPVARGKWHERFARGR
ncbi:uncharacterized protein GGS22DRAFT_150454 [Annulohypoxylon maeteangense]|uniref:uncharacterized protein n=1 Tax=Annulohypoxylon maeteangense TaxID=1927788 RepID=UPI002007E11A|nr:uncharacterized protein GGS22DRAFT_150454 [Annulohypoxylon maeteangense]KAI0890272.1 hypothetical protein GGS22DRAFT_150454 [Annulohypoxylon maeteangense]